MCVLFSYDCEVEGVVFVDQLTPPSRPDFLGGAVALACLLRWASQRGQDLMSDNSDLFNLGCP